MNITIIENHVISANTVRRKLTETLVADGYNITILTTGNSADLEMARRMGCEVIDVGASNTNPLRVVTYMSKLYFFLQKKKTDVCLTFTMRPAIWGNMVCRRLNIPVITNITGIGPLAESDTLAYKLARLLYRSSLKKTKVVFFQNKDDLGIFKSRNYVRAEQVQIIPGSGVDTDYFYPREKELSEKFIFLFIGRLIKDKGIFEFVAAAEIIKKQYPQVVCQIVGPYYDQNLKSNIISEKQIMYWLDEGIVHYMGAADDVRSFIAQADCIVLPSYREGMSNVLLEAAGMERPAIASDVTGCRDIITDNITGFLCKVKDAEDLAAKMIKMVTMTPDGRIAMGKAARVLIKEKFAKKIVLDAYSTEIQKIINK